MSKVSMIKIKDSTEDNTEKKVKDAVRKSMELADWKRYISKNEDTLLKVNMCWADFLLPGMCTSPYVLSGVVETIQDYVGDIYVGEGMASAFQSFSRGCKVNKWKNVAKKYGVKLIDLSKEQYVDVEVSGLSYPIVLSKKAIEIPNLISLPLMKTHSVTKFTGALKNLFGISFGKRILYHLDLSKVIVEINRITKPNFAVMDATIGLEGNGPANGIPKEMDLVLSSPDLVALDATACRIMKLDPDEVVYLAEAQKAGLGSTHPEVVGNVKIGDVKADFIPPLPQAYYEKGMLPLLKNKSLRNIVYTYFWLPGRFVVKINRDLWYLKEGSKYTKNILKNSKYRNQWLDK